jgi:hypothetical protein
VRLYRDLAELATDLFVQQAGDHNAMTSRSRRLSDA